MKKKLDTRFPAARIKKIMQIDEEVGKIALSTPLLVSKALELFLQDLLDRTHGIMRDRGGKTLNSGHLKLCLEQHKEYDFLKDLAASITETASETPRPGLDATGSNSMGRGRRKNNESDEPELECSEDSVRKSFKMCREQGPGSPNQEIPRLANRGMKRQLSSASSKSMDFKELHLPQQIFKKPKEETPREFQPPVPVKAEANGSSKGFDLNFDLNSDAPVEESGLDQAPTSVTPTPEPPKMVASKPSCDSDEDYDAE